MREKKGGRSEWGGACPVGLWSSVMVGLLALWPQVAVAQWVPTDIVLGGGAAEQAVGIGDNGWVTGNYRSASGGKHAFVWAGSGAWVDLGTLGGTVSFGAGTNAVGQAVGISATVRNAAYPRLPLVGRHGHGRPRHLRLMPTAMRSGINSAGHVAGYVTSPGIRPIVPLDFGHRHDRSGTSVARRVRARPQRRRNQSLARASRHGQHQFARSRGNRREAGWSYLGVLSGAPVTEIPSASAVNNRGHVVGTLFYVAAG